MRKNFKIFGKIPLLHLGLIILAVIIVAIIFRSFSNSLFVKNKSRLNVGFYEKYPVIYSLGINDGINYVISLSPDTKVTVPGGYGMYRIGALGKLVALENNPKLYQRTFSAAISSLVDNYYYSGHTEIYFGSDKPNPKLPDLRSLIFYNSNSSFFDRLYIAGKILGKRIENFTHLYITSEFAKQYQGYLYAKTYRNEKSNVQIIYAKSYKTGLQVSSIMEGSGIRVSDVGEGDRDISNNEKCKIIVNSKAYPETVAELSSFFDCGVVYGKTGAYDILFKLESDEKFWD